MVDVDGSISCANGHRAILALWLGKLADAGCLYHKGLFGVAILRTGIVMPFGAGSGE